MIARTRCIRIKQAKVVERRQRIEKLWRKSSSGRGVRRQQAPLVEPKIQQQLQQKNSNKRVGKVGGSTTGEIHINI